MTHTLPRRETRWVGHLTRLFTDADIDALVHQVLNVLATHTQKAEAHS